jgi:hypothetical protein
MDKYILNLISRARAFGKKLNKIVEFMDRDWTLHDEFGNTHVFRFKSGGVLRKSLNGNFTDMKWELEGEDAIAIHEQGSSKGEIFRYCFFLDGVLVVQKEGTTTVPTIFYNPSVIVDGDIKSYLYSYILNKEKLNKIDDSKEYFFKNPHNLPLNIGQAVFDNNLQPVSHATIKTSNKIILIENGLIKSITYYLIFDSNQGPIKIYSKYYDLLIGKIFKGDRVDADNDNIISGKIQLKGKSDATLTIDKNIIIKISHPDGFSKEAQVLIYLLTLLSLVLAAVMSC